jgi:hypothetical protein
MNFFPRCKTLSMLPVLGLLLATPGVANADPGDAYGTCAQPLTSDQADAAMKPLYAAFNKVDQAFNGSSSGLTVAEVAQLGYFADRTQVLAFGPFAQVGPLGPGATASIGIQESSQLQVYFEGGLKAAYGPGTKLQHHMPTVSVVWPQNRRANVNSFADVFDDSGNEVAVVKGLAQYYIPCDSTMVPTIDWIHFTLQVLVTP